MDVDIPSTVAEPLDLVKLSLSERVYVKMRGDRVLTGVLHAFDAHCNLVLSDVEEKVTLVDVSDEGVQLGVRTATRNMEMLFVRGDAVIMIAPPVR